MTKLLAKTRKTERKDNDDEAKKKQYQVRQELK